MSLFASGSGCRLLPAVGCAVALAGAGPASAGMWVFGGFDAMGPGVVTAATGTSPDTPPVGLKFQLVADLQLPSYFVGIASNATGQFHFDQTGAQIFTTIYVDPGQGYPITGWSFQSPATMDFTLNHGVVTDFGFHMTDGQTDRMEVSPGLFSVHFITGQSHQDVYDFNGTWDYQGATPHLRYSYVPEPAAWALMLMGFGLVGVAMRRAPARDWRVGAA